MIPKLWYEILSLSKTETCSRLSKVQSLNLFETLELIEVHISTLKSRLYKILKLTTKTLYSLWNKFVDLFGSKNPSYSQITTSRVYALANKDFKVMKKKLMKLFHPDLNQDNQEEATTISQLINSWKVPVTYQSLLDELNRIDIKYKQDLKDLQNRQDREAKERAKRELKKARERRDAATYWNGPSDNLADRIKKGFTRFGSLSLQEQYALQSKYHYKIKFLEYIPGYVKEHLKSYTNSSSFSDDLPF